MAELNSRTQGLVKAIDYPAIMGPVRLRHLGTRLSPTLPRPQSEWLTCHVMRSCSTCWYKETACTLSFTPRAEWRNCHKPPFKSSLGIRLSPVLLVLQLLQCVSCIKIISPSLSSIVLKIQHLQFSPVLFSFAVVCSFLRSGQLVGIQRSSSAHCVWSVQQSGHPPGQSRGKGVCQKRCPQQTEPSLGTALWSAPLLPFFMPETIPDYWNLWNTQSSLLSYFHFYIWLLILFSAWISTDFKCATLRLFCFTVSRKRRKVGAG